MRVGTRRRHPVGFIQFFFHQKLEILAAVAHRGRWHHRRILILRCFFITELMDGQGRRFRVGSLFRYAMVRRSSKFRGLGRLAFRGGKMAYYGHGHDVDVVMLLFCLSFGFGSGCWARGAGGRRTVGGGFSVYPK